MRIIAHLKDIVYVDYRLVDPDQVQSAREHFQDELFEVYEEEKRKAEEMQKVEELHQRQQQLKDANLEGINTLLDEMLKDDTEQEKLKNLTFWPEVIDELQHEFRCNFPCKTKFLNIYAGCCQNNSLKTQSKKMSRKKMKEAFLKMP